MRPHQSSPAARWENWSGSVAAAPHLLAAPRNEAELEQLVATALEEAIPLRITGSGHSFVPLCETPGTLVSLDALQGLLASDATTATVHAGTKLHCIGEPLLRAGFAMENLGDIDRQSIAGAISTGTHGTGASLGSISTQVVGLRLIDGSGEIIECSRTCEPELLQVARVSLGALGAITRVSLRVLPAYRLHERSWVEPFADCVAAIPRRVGANRHFEFFWVPGGDVCAIKTLNPSALDAAPANARPPEVTGWAARYVRPERVDWSYRIFPSLRDRLFNEQEFALPAENGVACLRELRELMRTRHREVAWPVEYRTVAADDIALSPACGRDTVTLSVHQAAGEPYERFFADTEAIFRNHHGRPHWGKHHTHRARELERLYPEWQRFLAVRERLDPRGRFLNDYLRGLLGVV